MYEINETHDPNLKSWVESANDPSTDFPIQNLPFCVYEFGDTEPVLGIGFIIGDKILDIYGCINDELMQNEAIAQFASFRFWTLNAIAGFAPGVLSDLRRQAVYLLSEKNKDRVAIAEHLYSISDVRFEAAFKTGDYTDFYCSIYHATNVGSMFRPDNPLMPNYKYIPIGYHGRASSIVVSGTDIKRPHGQNRSDAEKPPVFIPCKNLDYEMELGFFVGKGNEMGQPILMSEAENHIFGVCLVNDFLAKNFATTISPYVVTMEALAPFRTKAFERDTDDPQPLGYLNDEGNKNFGGLDINLEVYIQSEKMRNENIEPHLLSRSNTKDLYWTIGQMLTHHASGGCNLQTGDLMATGTVSGKEKHERGCLLELTWRGTEPLELPSGEQRRFLEDGDEIIMKGFCEREGFRRIGLGECRGRILPAD
ncbi:MAG: fumarylacetoacetase [Acidobacteria bacterium]|nr:MAG: fumarylacetoacetase [Acidobacteriota bacterium]